MRHGIVAGVLAIAACGGHGHGSQSPDSGSGDGGDQTTPTVTISNATVAGEACAATVNCDCLVFGGDTVAFDVAASDQDGIASLAYQAAFATAGTTRADMAMPAGAPSSASSPFTFQVPANVGTEAVQLVANATDPASNTGTSPPLRLCAAPPPAQRMPVVAWEDSSTGTRQVYLRRWNSSAWVELGGSGSGGGISQASSTTLAGAPVVAVGPDGNPVVAWTTRSSSSGATSNIYVKKWNGSAWVELAGSASGAGISNASGLGAQQASIAIDSQDRIYVAWPDAAGAPPIWTYLKRWNGTAWEELGGSASGTGLSGNSDASDPFVAIDRQDRPVVAWNEEFSSGCWVWARRWNGTTWEELAGSASGAGVGGVPGGADPSVAIDHDGNPSIGWQGATSDGIIVMHWDGAAWSAVGSAPTADTGCSAGWPYMVGIDARNRPAIAGQTGGVQRWNGAAWINIAQPGTHSQQPHGFAADGLGYTLVWSQAVGGTHNAVYLQRWDGSAWQEIGGSASGNGVSGNTTGYAGLPNVAQQ